MQLQTQTSQNYIDAPPIIAHSTGNSVVREQIVDTHLTNIIDHHALPSGAVVEPGIEMMGGKHIRSKIFKPQKRVNSTK